MINYQNSHYNRLIFTRLSEITCDNELFLRVLGKIGCDNDLIAIGSKLSKVDFSLTIIKDNIFYLKKFCCYSCNCNILLILELLDLV